MHISLPESFYFVFLLHCMCCYNRKLLFFLFLSPNRKNFSLFWTGRVNFHLRIQILCPTFNDVSTEKYFSSANSPTTTLLHLTFVLNDESIITTFNNFHQKHLLSSFPTHSDSLRAVCTYKLTDSPWRDTRLLGIPVSHKWVSIYIQTKNNFYDLRSSHLSIYC